MGEIGYNEEAFLYELIWWQIRSIIRGYRKRERTSWLQTRWQTWCILTSLGAKIDSPEQLLPLPFDRLKTQAEIDADDEALKELIKQCKEHNRKITQEEENGNNR